MHVFVGQLSRIVIIISIWTYIKKNVLHTRIYYLYVYNEHVHNDRPKAMTAQLPFCTHFAPLASSLTLPPFAISRLHNIGQQRNADGLLKKKKTHFKLQQQKRQQQQHGLMYTK